jgi:hypothetical protein
MNDRSRSKDHQFGLVPTGLNYGATAPIIYLTLSALATMGGESSVEQYISAQPAAHQAILALSRAVARAGIRMAESDPKAVIDDHLRLFSAEEIWMVDLAIDVVAMLGTGGSLHGDTRVRVLDKLKELDRHVDSHQWRKLVHKAGAGPAEFQQLRTHIPPHKPRPDAHFQI